MDLPAACELTQTRRLVVTGCRRWSGCFGCMRPRFIADGGAVNGIHSSRFNCYRIPAGCLVTVLPPWVHAARRRIWPFDHAPGASDACGMRSQHLFIFENGFSRENSSICFVGAGNLVACRQGWWSKVTAMCKGANRGLHASKPIHSREISF